MCLIALSYRQHPTYHFILLANRDEFYHRPTAAMDWWPGKSLLAGKDLQAGGSWLGLSEEGRLATITNYRNGNDRRDYQSSRGELVTNFLQQSDNATQHAENIHLRGNEYDGFNLLLADQQQLVYTSNRHPAPLQLTAGRYLLCNALLDTPWPKTERLRQKFDTTLKATTPEPQQLLDLMKDPQQAAPEQLPDTGISDEWEQRLSSIFIEMENYGTRATTLLMQDHEGQTTLIEQRYQPGQRTESSEFKLQLPLIGGS